MKLVIEIDMDSDALATRPRHELTRIFSDIKRNMDFNGVDESITLRDENGNTVGKAEVVADA